MDSLEPKKLALIRVLQILKKYSDYNHPMLQEDIAKKLESDYGIVLERKAISRNINLLREAGYVIESVRAGNYLDEREFEDSELRMLIDGVLSSKYITASHSKSLIEKLCGMSNKYFRSHVGHVYSVNDWSKTDNQALFYNIELIDDAIERRVQLKFDYNKYGIDKKLHKSSTNRVTPYQLILHNQRYYLMAHNEHWGNITFYRVDHITKMVTDERPATPITDLDGYKSGIDYKHLASAMPYMYTDQPQQIEFKADLGIVDQIIDWFGTDIRITPIDEKSVTINLKASPNAMEHWATQYINYVEVIKPTELRQRIHENLKSAEEKYR
ncbi:MAG: WYL domain-containing transcriptional regulator [Clostridia bacterium]|nr:WYL domain-containing transcriptional regulator [Clostridia bacterium]